MSSFVKAMYVESSTSVRAEAGVTEKFNVKVAIRQGPALTVN